jgi:hypothetical protein
MLKEWDGCVAIVLPTCSGKTTLALRFSGYDLDEIVADGSEDKLDEELDEMLYLRETALVSGDRRHFVEHNNLLFRRAARFFSTVRPDSNARVVYCHTAELAEALGLRVLCIYSLDEAVVANSQRMLSCDPQVRQLTLRLFREQAGANDAYATRHGLGLVRAGSYGILQSMVGSVLLREGVLGQSEVGNSFHALLDSVPSEEVLLNRSLAILRDTSNPAWVKACAARQLKLSMHETAPAEAHAAYNYPVWAEITHTIASQTRGKALSTVPDWSEDEWRAAFPLGPGNATFALCNVTDWVRLTGSAALDAPHSWMWFKQLLSQANTRVNYERLLCFLVFGDIVEYVVPQHRELLNTYPMGLLDSVSFAAVAKKIHNTVRVGLNYLGVPIKVSDLTFFTYFDCLAGRVIGTENIEAEIEDRNRLNAPKVYYHNGRWSEAEFDRRLKASLDGGYAQLGIGFGSVLKNMGHLVDTFEHFMENRRRWVKPGSATGSPKADIYLRVPTAHAEALDEITKELGDMTVLVLKRVRLNKSALFEFREFVPLVKEALRDYVPNAFTKHFFKHEPGKFESRALFPSHLMHYIMVSHVLHLAEKGGEIDNTRLTSGPEIQREDHWMWRECHDTSVHLMLDYANFNETHEVKHMKMCIDGLRTIYAQHHALSADLEFAIGWVVESFDRIVLEHGDQLVLLAHGLLSGMRCTSFVNSILNRGYIHVIGEQVGDFTGVPMFVEHQSGGDDVAAEARTAYEVALALRVGKAMGFVFKDIKQLVSYKYREFFRLFVAEDGVYGSLCRMLGSALSGQWSNSILPKFIEPAAKLGSVIEIARKAGRRARSITFMEKVAACAFEKWATDKEGHIAHYHIHGTTETGGLGIPTAQGDIYELDGVPETEETIEPVGVPTDASRHLAADMVADAAKLVGPDSTVDVGRLASQLAVGAFTSSIAQSRGPSVLRVRGARVDRKPVRIKSIREADFATEPLTSSEFQAGIHTRSLWLRANKRAGSRYAAISQAVAPKHRRALASAICRETPGSDPDVIYYWKAELQLYGCATYLLTEDYYEDVVLLSLGCGELSSDAVSRQAARYAIGLSRDGYMYY